MSTICDENHSPLPLSQKCKPMSPFVAKLRLLLQQQKYKNAIRWSPDGRSLVISDIETFKDQVLETDDEMFKTKNFASFVRQLNLYGFRKLQINNAKGDPTVDMHFEHPNFRRDRPDLIALVHRTCNSAKKRALIRSMHESYSPKRLRFESESSVSIVSPLVDRQNEMATPLSEEKPSLKSMRYDYYDSSKSILTNQNAELYADFKAPLINQSGSQEHDYAIPIFGGFNCEPLDERRLYSFLDRQFNDEIVVVQALLSLSTQHF
ncbi:heat shock factor protein 5-like [Rhopilema esculentum]|uniref:heat shock factor protein 5-like n=1 Tax=Rhopilema esculentum TaxID=499914 RepID=UPI0031E3D4A7|eukprot:gene13092-3881_t